MELNKFKRKYYFLILIPVTLLFLLGSWWLFLVFKLASRLDELNHSLMEGNLLTMVKWEGASFITLLFLLTMALFWIYIQDYKKNKSLQAFFASLTHELKTPLASINLQAQVLGELLEDMQLPSEQNLKLKKYIERLNIESTRLEDQLDNHLQLSRIERDAPINMREIPLRAFIEQQFSRYSAQISSKINISPEITVLGDDYAMQIIFRNLIENSMKHRSHTNNVITVDVTEDSDRLEIKYDDSGAEFTGDASKLGKLFFKHNSPKGTGIGLYLIDRLLKKMNGSFKVVSQKNLVFYLTFMTRAKS